MKKYCLIIVITLLTTFFLVGLTKPAQAACNFHESMTATNKDISNWSTTCTIAGTEGVDNPGNTEGSTTSTASLTLTSGAITINNGGVLRASSISLSGGTISLQNGGKIEPGSTQPLYVSDGDADAWANDFTLYTATASGRRRLGLMKGFNTSDCNDGHHSGTNTCVYRRPITLTYSGGTLTNHDVVLDFDTATAIAAGKMTADCGDIRVRDSDETTALTYWIEGGCNTSTTQVWVTVPSVPDGGKTIYLEYDGTTAADGWEAWAGTFTLMYTTTCPSGWTRNSDFDNSFLRGASTYGGTGGASSHSHAQKSCTTGEASNNNPLAGQASGNNDSTLTHTHANATVDVDSATSVLPPYRNVVMCKKADLTIPSGFIALFDAAVGTGWTDISNSGDDFNAVFPRGSTVANAGNTGGATTHSHSTTGGNTTNAGSGSQAIGGGTADTNKVINTHTHDTSNGTTGTGNHLPPYLNMIFGSKDADGAAKAGIITMVDVLPPRGWSRFTALDNNLVRGSGSYGGTGGSDTHNHTVSIATGGKSGTSYGARSGAVDGTHNHTHSCSAGNTNSKSNLPPYTEAIFAQRNTPSATTSIGSESLY